MVRLVVMGRFSFVSRFCSVWFLSVVLFPVIAPVMSGVYGVLFCRAVVVIRLFIWFAASMVALLVSRLVQ